MNELTETGGVEVFFMIELVDQVLFYREYFGQAHSIFISTVIPEGKIFTSVLRAVFYKCPAYMDGKER